MIVLQVVSLFAAYILVVVLFAVSCVLLVLGLIAVTLAIAYLLKAFNGLVARISKDD